MNVDTGQVRQCLKSFDFKRLFIQELNWSHCTSRPLDLEIDGDIARIIPLAELGGVVVYQVELLNSGGVPPSIVRRQIENKIKQLTHEHVIIFVDSEKSKSVWQWIKRGSGFQTATREHTYYRYQPGDSLMAKLDGIAFDISELDTDGDGNVKVIKVVERLRKAFDVEKVTKRFFEEFKKEHDAFKKFLKGIEGQDDQAWYVSVMLNRLMFIYFIQKKGFLDGDTNYLANKLKESRLQGTDQFYKKFITRLFFEGFAKEENERPPEAKKLLGHVPYLNGGIFQKHKLEEENPNITIPDTAFEKIITFFDRYNWHLDYRPLKADNEINPDVLGYIFEKYINQKQMGAYYTKEDITDYICKNTIIPFLFDKLENMRYDELRPFPMKDVEPYIYGAVKQKDYLPTEIEREYQDRQKRYKQIRDNFTSSKITNINDLITYNLNIRQFAEDWLAGIKDPLTLRAFYFHCLTKVTVLDPAVGSGAFLFAALNMLEPLYEICLDKMEELGGPKYPDFAEELKRISQHPNRQYFILKSIIVNNLFGVDIMEEAVEICKLRLFLKLVAQVDDVNKIEPLPDIDFNIRAGNTLVGYTNLEQIRAITKVGGAQGKMDLGGEIERIDQSAQSVDRAFQSFRALQTRINVDSRELSKAKAGLNQDLGKLQDELNLYLAGEYGTDTKKPAAYERWLSTHQPFHWFVEFHGIMKDGGFDAIIGNPPFLEQRQVEYGIPANFKCRDSSAIHAMFIERGLQLLRNQGCMSMIMPMAAVSTQRMKTLQEIVEKSRNVWYSNYSWRPAKLFDAVNRAISMLVITPSSQSQQGRTFSTNYQKWVSDDRSLLMQKLVYVEVPRTRPYFWVPKLGHDIEKPLLNKLVGINTTLGKFMLKGQYKVYYRTTGGLYWKVFTDFPPAFKVNGKQGHSSRETWFTMAEQKLVKSTIAMLSSDVFWWWYTISTNCRDLNPNDLQNFPIPEQALYDAKLIDLGSLYLGDLQKNSTMLVREQKQTGRTETQSFKIQKSKPVITQIDRLLARHYGFTEEEMDFIINYDIKFRMGKDNGEDTEE